jgi:hypothetical protein
MNRLLILGGVAYFLKGDALYAVLGSEWLGPRSFEIKEAQPVDVADLPNGEYDVQELRELLKRPRG